MMLNFGLSAKEVDQGVYRISGLGVYRYLFVGDEYALLMDTGYGISNIKKVVAKITDKPLIVVNSHFHPDHSNGNQLFDKIYINEHDLPFVADRPLSLQRIFDAVDNQLKESHPKIKLVEKKLESAILSGRSKKTTYIPVEDDYEFDLGGRTLTLHWVPGHTEGSCVLVDWANQIIYTGDSCNTGFWLWTNLDATASTYADTLDQFYKYAKANHIKGLRCSHSPMTDKLEFIKFYEKSMRKLAKGKKKPLVKIGIPGLPSKLCVGMFAGLYKRSFFGAGCFYLEHQAK